MRILFLMILSLATHAQAQESPQQIRWSAGTYNQISIQNHTHPAFGLALATEMPIQENSRYWIEALGKIMDRPGGADAQIFLGPVRHFNLTHGFEFDVALGPEWAHSSTSYRRGNYFAINVQATGTYWINEHWGVSAVPSYQAVFRNRVESLAGISAMLTYGR